MDPSRDLIRRQLARLAVVAALSVGVACGQLEPVEPIVPSTDTFTTAGSSSGEGTADQTATETATDTTSTADSGGSAGTAAGTADGTTGPAPCPTGAEGCACTPMGGCDPGLQCLSEVCVDPGGGCPVGSESCPCTPGGGCDPGLTCLSEVCVDPR